MNSKTIKSHKKACDSELRQAKQLYHRLVRRQKLGEGNRANVNNIKRLANIITNYKTMLRSLDRDLQSLDRATTEV